MDWGGLSDTDLIYISVKLETGFPQSTTRFKQNNEEFVFKHEWKIQIDKHDETNGWWLKARQMPLLMQMAIEVQLAEAKQSNVFVPKVKSENR